MQGRSGAVWGRAHGEQWGYGDRYSGGSTYGGVQRCTGWTKPGNQAVTINNGQTTSATGTYVRQLGSLR